MRRKNDVSTLRYARSFERLQLHVRTSVFNAGSIFVPGVCAMEVYISFLHGKSSLLLKLHRKRYIITNFDLITIQLLIRKYCI